MNIFSFFIASTWSSVIKKSKVRTKKSAIFAIAAFRISFNFYSDKTKIKSEHTKIATKAKEK